MTDPTNTEDAVNLRRSKSFELKELLGVKPPKIRHVTGGDNRFLAGDRPVSTGKIVTGSNRPQSTGKIVTTSKSVDRNMVNNADNSSVASHNSRIFETPIGNAAGRIKSKMMAAISRGRGLKASGSTHSILHAGSQETISNCGRHSWAEEPIPERPPVKQRHKISAEQWVHDTDLCLKYVREVVRTGKMEMLSGSVSAVLDILLKLLISLGERNKLTAGSKVTEACSRLYRSMNALLGWADQKLLDCALHPNNQPSDANLQESSKALQHLTDELQKALRGLLILTTGQDQTDGSVCSSANGGIGDGGCTPPPPPKPLHPSQKLGLISNSGFLASDPPPLPPRKKKGHRRSSPPMSGDSGIFEGTISLDVSGCSDDKSNQANKPKVSPRLFSEKSLDDILSNLSMSGKNFSQFSERLDDSAFIDDSSPSSSEGETIRVEFESMVNGKRVQNTQVSTTRQIISKSSSNQVSVDTGGELTPELLKLLRESKNGEVKITEHQQVHLKGMKQSSVELKPAQPEQLSPYDNVNPIDVEIMQSLPQAPPIPPKRRASLNTGGKSVQRNIENSKKFANGAMSGTLEERLLMSNSCSESLSKQTTVNGSVVQRDTSLNTDAAQLAACKSAFFQNGQVVNVKGSGSFEESSCSKRTNEKFPAFVNQDATDNAAPPLPPKRRHVVTYIQILGNNNSGSKQEASDNVGEMQETEKQAEFRKSTLASYVHLRNKLCQHEETHRHNRFSFSFSSPASGSGSVNRKEPLNRALSGPEVVNLTSLHRNLADYWTASDKIQLPKPLSVVTPKQQQLSYERRMALPVASILGTVDASEWLVVRKNEDDVDEVRGGSCDALIAYATQPGCHILLYQEAFLITYRTFITPLDLLRRLIWRYQHLSSTATAEVEKGGERARKKAARNTFCLIVRIVDDLGCFELNMELMQEVNSLIYRLIDEGDLTLARLLRQRFIDRVELKAGFRSPIPLLVSPNSVDDDASKNRPSILDLKSEHLAEQLTVLDSQLFQRIELSEMLTWAQEQAEERSPNLVIFTEHFNRVSFWVRTRVVQQPEHRDRERHFAKFLKIMKHLRRLGNFNSYLAILSALESGPVRRLDWCRTIRDGLQEHSSIMDSSQSFKIYRNALADAMPPCLPYIGLILQDLTFVHVGNPNLLPGDQSGGRSDLLNFLKRWQQFTILDSVRRFKAWSFNIKKDDRILSAFENFKNFLNEDEIWNLSESIKPRGSGRRSPIKL